MANPYPRLDTNWLRARCGIPPRPFAVTGWLRQLLVRHFQAANLVDPDQTVQKMVWAANEAATGIVIESHTAWRPELTEKHPAVMIKRNGWKRLRLGIGDKMMGLTELNAQEVFANAWQGSHTLFCIAGKGPEAEKLAAETYGELNEFAAAVREKLDLLRFEVTEVGELLLLEEGRQNFVVPVVVAYAFIEAWRVNRELPALRQLDATFVG